jgi:hypothetical protein
MQASIKTDERHAGGRFRSETELPMGNRLDNELGGFLAREKHGTTPSTIEPNLRLLNVLNSGADAMAPTVLSGVVPP